MKLDHLPLLCEWAIQKFPPMKTLGWIGVCQILLFFKQNDGASFNFFLLR